MSSEEPKYKIKRLAKHTLFSLGGTATDTLVLWVCSTFLLTSNYVLVNVVSPGISFECGNIVNFIISSKLVFKDRTQGLKFKAFLKRFLAFNASYTTTFFLKMALLLLIQVITKWDVVWCNLIALCITGFANFEVNDKLIFRNKQSQEEPIATIEENGNVSTRCTEPLNSATAERCEA